MGVLPLQFMGADSAQSLGITGNETIDILGLEEIRPQQEIKMRITNEARILEVTLKSRIDTAIEVDYYRHGGILPYVLRELIGRAGPAAAKAA
jgi:aconitate hydratase